MKSVYESVYDIDLFIGGVTEYPMPDAALGPTFANIFAYQFSNLRRTDRFFYNFNINQPTGFSSGNSSLILSDSFLAKYDDIFILGFYHFIRSTGRNSKSFFGAYHLRQQ